MLSQVCYSCLALAAAVLCCLVSSSGLVNGPLCLHNTTAGLAWGAPFARRSIRDPVYLYDRTLWGSVCEEPRNVVLWNVVLFSLLMATSGVQALLCAAQALNSVCGVVIGRGWRNNKISPVSV